MSLTVGSLFAGIGGIELGLERAGMEVVWQVEKDDYCRLVLAKHWPDVARYEDVRDVGAENLEPVDLICGGFPCQEISHAGKGWRDAEGLYGERSGLWSEMWRIIRELRPCFALVENVPAIRSNGIGRVLGDMAEIGYDAEWHSIPASAVGAPHQRDRVFILVYPGSERLQTGKPGARNVGSPERKPILTGNPSGTARVGRSEWETERPVCRVADGVPGRVDRLRALGNAVVPQVAEWIGQRIVDHAETTP